MAMPNILHVADNARMGRGATIRFADGSPCTLSIANTGIIVKKSRIGLFGSVLYSEKNVYKNAQNAFALACLFPERRFPDAASDPILRSFLNAILHCSSVADVAITLNGAVAAVERRFGRKIDEIGPSDLPAWATERTECE